MNKQLQFNKQKLFNDNIGLVYYVAKQFMPSFIDYCEYDDLVQIGKIGLLKAARTYNGSAKFSTYSTWCISNELRLEYRKVKRTIQSASFEEVLKDEKDMMSSEKNLHDVVPDINTIFTNNLNYNYTLEHIINILLNYLDAKELEIVLGLILNKRQIDIANDLGVSQSNIARKSKRIYYKIFYAYKRDAIFDKYYNVEITYTKKIIYFFTDEMHKLSNLKKYMYNNCGDIVIENNSNGCFKVEVDQLANIFKVIKELLDGIRKYNIRVITKK